MTREYYAMIGDERRGPYTIDELFAVGVDRNTFVWFEGSRDWLLLCDVPELAAVFDNDQLILPGMDDDSIRTFPASYLETPLYYGNVLWIIALGWSLFFNYQGTSFGLEVAILGLCGAVVLWFLAVLSYLMLWYRAWDIVQDGHARMTPSAAIGWLFVPVFNVYWIFRASVGLVRDLDAYAARHRLHAPPAPFFSAIAVSVYSAWTLVPFLGLTGTLLNFFFFPYFMNRIRQTAVCLCAENRKKSPSTVFDHSANKSMPSAIAAAILFPIGFLMCASPCFITPFPYHLVFAISPQIEAAMIEPALQRDARLRGRAHDVRNREHLRQMQIEAISDFFFFGADMNIRPILVAFLGMTGALVVVFAFGITSTNSVSANSDKPHPTQ